MQSKTLLQGKTIIYHSMNIFNQIKSKQKQKQKNKTKLRQTNKLPPDQKINLSYDCNFIHLFQPPSPPLQKIVQLQLENACFNKKYHVFFSQAILRISMTLQIVVVLLCIIINRG